MLTREWLLSRVPPQMRLQIRNTIVSPSALATFKSLLLVVHPFDVRIQCTCPRELLVALAAHKWFGQMHLFHVLVELFPRCKHLGAFVAPIRPRLAVLAVHVLLEVCVRPKQSVAL